MNPLRALVISRDDETRDMYARGFRRVDAYDGATADESGSAIGRGSGFAGGVPGGFGGGGDGGSGFGLGVGG